MLFNPNLPSANHRSNWVRLRTIIVLRWIAIAGQLAAITLAQRLFKLDLDLGLCFLAVGASIAANLFAIYLYPENKRLTEPEVALNLTYDILQLSFLLFLTGGLNNPFALLILVPVTISATALNIRITVALGTLTIILITLVASLHIPLVTLSGNIMAMPRDFVIGFWFAIVIGVVFLGAFAQRVTSEIHAMSDALVATQMALEREQKLTDLGGVVAAAAHELGTPLATIKLVSSELVDELGEDPILLEDAQLIGEQVDRCRDILRSMGRAGHDDKHLKQAPVATVIHEAAEPHENRGKLITFDTFPEDGASSEQPVMQRRPEVVHGVRNLVQNAVDFAKANVWISISWNDTDVTLRIVDDGPGYPPQLIGRIGDPFVRQRSATKPSENRPGYEGMGLGLFIAKTLLERSDAEISFANGYESSLSKRVKGEKSGAIVEVIWPRGKTNSPFQGDVGPLGLNEPIEA